MVRNRRLVGHYHRCLLSDGPILPPGAPKVLMGGEGAFAARLGDGAECRAAGMIATGSGQGPYWRIACRPQDGPHGKLRQYHGRAGKRPHRRSDRDGCPVGQS